MGSYSTLLKKVILMCLMSFWKSAFWNGCRLCSRLACPHKFGLLTSSVEIFHHFAIFPFLFAYLFLSLFLFSFLLLLCKATRFGIESSLLMRWHFYARLFPLSVYFPMTKNSSQLVINLELQPPSASTSATPPACCSFAVDIFATIVSSIIYLLASFVTLFNLCPAASHQWRVGCCGLFHRLCRFFPVIAHQLSPWFFSRLQLNVSTFQGFAFLDAPRFNGAAI